MIQKKQYSTEIGGKTLTLEISSLADQANAAVVAKYGETVVLTTVVMSHEDIDADYMPLKVDYEEKFYAAGKIIGSRFIRRESRPSEDAILAGRMVDRTIRPLFDQRIRKEIQVVVTVLEYDEENDPEFVGLIGASAALGISDIPWNGPVAGVRLAQIGGSIKINPTNSEVAEAKPAFNAFVSGSYGRINMIELCGNDAEEKNILEAFALAQEEIDKLIDFQRKMVKEIGKPKAGIVLHEFDPQLRTAVEEFLSGKLEEAVYKQTKVEYLGSTGKLREELHSHIKENFEEPNIKDVDYIFEEEINNLVHKNILEKDRRPDGRKLNQIRELQGEVGLFPRTHGSALFIRGNTQALGITTLAPPGAEQLIETMEVTGKRRFMLHYNFPPYSVGEIGSFRGPGRREIGHGNLARKAVEPLIPPKEEFPYTIRVVSEILSSNGSSSMATVCASVLSLMDAGVPLRKPAAGIAMGLMMETQTDAERTQTDADKIPRSSALSQRKSAPAKFKILTDIQGPEDHHGDMDLKVAGTEDGVNAIQMDVKIDGLTLEIIEKVLAQAREARLEILKFMKSVIAAPKPQLSKYVPTIRQLKINPDRIGTLIGPGGKMINGLIAKYGLAGIDVEEDGGVFVSGPELAKVEAAVAEITALTKEFKVGEIIEGKVIKTLDFGAIVDLGGGRDGMIHVSELKQGFVKTVGEVVKVGDFVRAKIIRVDEDGHIGLSIKQL
jgi:polyribonucleotide nucleotidyltransferase